jgi:gliding motility-associated-like protein
MKKFTAVFCAFAISILSLIAQSDTTFFNKGAAVFIKPGAIFHVNGNVVNSGASALFENKGTVEVENSINKGNFSFKTGSNIQGNGDFYIEGDWINNANFFTDATNNNSYVNLNGGNQLITGSNPSVFYDLELSGIGIKTQTINATVSNTLTLNDRELATQTNTMFVTNTAVNAVTNTQTFGSEGFVSSTGNGSLSRQTATPSAYLFPLGSSTGTKRYRAVEVTPATNNPNTFTGSFVNNDPTADGFNKDSVDAILCKVNDKYYHKLRRTNGGDAADLTFYYLPADGNFEALAQWGTPAVTVWNNLGTV